MLQLKYQSRPNKEIETNYVIGPTSKNAVYIRFEDTRKLSEILADFEGIVAMFNDGENLSAYTMPVRISREMADNFITVVLKKP